MRSTRLLAPLALVAALGLSACGGGSSSADKPADNCKPKHTFTTLTKGTLTVAGFDLPPYTKLAGQDITGVDGDILKAFAKQECLTVTPKWMGTAAVIPTVQSNRADLGVGDWYRTEKRAAIVSLSDPLYLDQMGLISKDGITKIPDLKGKKVGTVDGYLWVEDLKKYLGSDLKVYPTSVALVQDMKSGRLDVGIDSYGSAVYSNPNLKVTVAEPDSNVAASQEAAQSAFVVPKQNADLLKAFNEFATTAKADGTIVKALESSKLDKSAADTGAARLIK